jgi:hypothetical protein
MYYRYRSYEPRVGRFAGRDLAQWHASGRPNLYAYVDGRPVTHVDPLGLIGERCFRTGVSDIISRSQTHKRKISGMLPEEMLLDLALGNDIFTTFKAIERRCICQVKCEDYDWGCICRWSFGPTGPRLDCRVGWHRDPSDDYYYWETVATRVDHASYDEFEREVDWREDKLGGAFYDTVLPEGTGSAFAEAVSPGASEFTGQQFLEALGGRKPSREEWTQGIRSWEQQCPKLCGSAKGAS